MKKSEYSNGEELETKLRNITDIAAEGFGAPFAYLFPQSSSVTHLNKDWISYDETDVGCQVRKQFANGVMHACNTFIEKYYSEYDVSVAARNLIATNSMIKRKQRTVLFLVNHDRAGEVLAKLPDVVWHVCSKVRQTQSDLFLHDDRFGLLPPEIDFLEDQVNEFRKKMSGKKIAHPFGIKSISSDSKIIGFSGEFETFEYDFPPAEEVSGLALVDGFREFCNTAYLTTIGENQIYEASKIFVLKDTMLLKKIAEANYFSKNIRFIADKVFERDPDKPTFILKSVEILG